MVVSKQQRGDALDAAEVFGAGVHRFSAPVRTRMSDVVGGWYGNALPATPAIRPSGAESRS